MNRFRHLEDIAKEKNWITFSQKLRAAMSSPEEFGLSRESEVILKVASLQGKDPASLQNPLSAEKWLAKNAPEKLSEKGQKVAMTNVLLLKQIHSLSEKVAKLYYEDVFDSSISRSELKQVLERTKSSEGVRGAVGHARWQRAYEFSNLAEWYISQNIYRFTDVPNSVLKQRSKNALLPCDLEIWSEEDPIAAIEIKVSREKSTRSFRAETLGLASLLTREFPKVFLVFSRGPEKPLEELVRLRNELNLTQIKIAVLDEVPSGNGKKARIEFW